MFMERFFKPRVGGALSGGEASNTNACNNTPKKIDVNDLPCDPSERPNILSYDPNQRDEIRRLYWLRGPCQPRAHVFPTKKIGSKTRRFVTTWFQEFRWLEYSVKVDKAYCLCCYLFRDQSRTKGSEAFVTEGWNNWNQKDRLSMHVGDVNSFHNRALKNCEALINQNQSIDVAMNKQNDIVRNEYRIRLNASIETCRFLLINGLPFRGHDESSTSLNKGLYLNLLKFYGNANEPAGKVTLKNAPGNNQMTAPSVQKDIANCFANEILKSIVQEVGDDVFALLVDESSDVSKKEQMAVVLRYVDTLGVVKERFIGLVHVMDTSSASLKRAIDSLFAQHGLSLKQVRGQGYDGASNMRGEFNGLKALILRENASAYYIHCFAHQLQLVVVGVAKHHPGIGNFFDMLALLVNVVNGSCKRKDMIRENYQIRVQDSIGKGELETGRGLNQELSLIRAGDTRWSSHYKTIMSLISLFPEVVSVLEYIEEEGDHYCSRQQAIGIAEYFHSFECVFYLHLMLTILGLTNHLSKVLQRKDQDILEAVSIVEGTKRQLRKFRESGFDTLLVEVYSFCDKHELEKLDMTEPYRVKRRQRINITNQHYYEYDIFNTVMDMQNREFDDRFNEVSTELLKNMAALSPCASFSQFNKSSLLKLTEFYPYDFNEMERTTVMGLELDLYYDIVSRDEKFANLNGIADLARLMVETRKHLSYPLVYRLLKLALVLPVATATVERCFSTMKLVKSDLRNRMSDDFLNASVICAIEKEALDNVTNEDIMDLFQKMKTRREQL